jgi:hypothetical protein
VGIRIVRLKLVLAGLAVTGCAVLALSLLWDPRMRREIEWELYAILMGVALVGGAVTMFGILDFGKPLKTKLWVENDTPNRSPPGISDSFE